MKKILKKVRVLSIVLFSIALAVTFLGCPSEAGSTPGGGGNTPSNPTATTRQQQIDYATAGSTVTLNASFSDTTIRINKALTVNGNNISGLTVIVDSSVRNNVTLRDFNNATISVASSSRRALANRMARTAEAADEEDPAGFPKMTDGAVPLHLEGCTIAKIESESDLALYLENGDFKSMIDEIHLMEGVEDFTFVEIDENGIERPDVDPTALDDKTRVGLLNIDDDGIKKINLIGGTFDDVDFADDISDELELMYDREFEDEQLHFDDKDTFFDMFANGDNIDAGKADVGKVIGGTGVYKFTITQTDENPACMYLQRLMTIVLMTQTQKQRLIDPDGLSSSGESDISATLDEPMYAVMPSGLFSIDWGGNHETLKTIYGSCSAYVDYARALSRGYLYGYEEEDIVCLDYFRNYNKEAFIAQVSDDHVDIFVDMAAIKKAELVLCSTSSDGSAYGEAGTKIADIDLTNYVPYLAFATVFPEHYWGQIEDMPISENYTDQDEFSDDWSAWTQSMWAGIENQIHPIKVTQVTAQGESFTYYPNDIVPYGDSIKLPDNYIFYFKAAENFNIQNDTYTPITYPDVSDVEYSEISTEGWPNPFVFE